MKKSSVIVFSKNSWLFGIVSNYQSLKAIDAIWHLNCSHYLGLRFPKISANPRQGAG
jgi:hypothetical protein